jgi:hypothetical protein
MNGKGSARRKGANDALYYQNYDNIFRKKKDESLSDDEIQQQKRDEDSLSFSELIKIQNRKNES